MIKHFISITKPGIIFGNLVSGITGFFLAPQPFDWFLFIVALLGTSLVIASGCVFNNIVDKDIDSIMRRTQNRVMVKGAISKKVALLYAFSLGLLGFIILYYFGNLLALLLALLGFFVYTVVYTLWLKRSSIHSTLVGSIAGATPPVIFFAVANGSLDISAFIIFLIMLFWQMPHSYAICIFNFKDYESANVKNIAVVKGFEYTKKHIVAYSIILFITSLLLQATGSVGYFYSIIAFLLGIIFLIIAFYGFRTKNIIKWSKTLFFYSIIYLTLLNITIIINTSF